MRSYPRSYGYRFNWGGLLTPAIKTLLIANTAVFLVQTLVHLFLSPEVELALNKGFGLVPRGVTHGLRLWQPFTYMFLHGGLWHLLINMLFLWMFGGDLERLWGKRRFYLYYFVTGVGAGCINILVKTLADPHGVGTSLGPPTVGASGAIYGILLAAAVVFPDRQVWLIPFPITLPMRVYVLIMGAIEFFGSLGSGGDNVSHITHLGGILVGYLYLRRGSFLYRVRNRYSDWKRRRLRRKFEVYMREHRDEPSSRPDRWVN
jgi:membrane associated rhomboid family serine protease